MTLWSVCQAYLERIHHEFDLPGRVREPAGSRRALLSASAGALRGRRVGAVRQSHLAAIRFATDHPAACVAPTVDRHESPEIAFKCHA